MNKRVNISSGTPWEEKVGYSRVVKVDKHIFVTGTVAVDDDGEIIGDTAFEQTDFIISKIEKYLNKVDATLNDVVRTRIFVTNIDDWEEIGKAHQKYFKSIKPATTMVEVSRLIGKNLLLEIEADAIIS
ncbi:MAG: RidA family protein [Ignavibacteriae bacterium]|nr:RidA family protein [Ignavibacteriota bacterium]